MNEATVRALIRRFAQAFGITDGDKGDITVSGGGTTWSIDAGAVDTTEIADGAVTFAKLNGAAVVTEGEGIASNDNDTTIPTSAAVKDYADSVGRVPLATKTASASATLDFTEFNNSVYRRYEFELDSILPATDNVALRMRTSTNGGSSYDTGASDYAYALTEKGAGAEVDATDSLAAAFMIICPSVGNAAGEQGVSGIVTVWGAGATAKTTVRTFLHAFDASDGSPLMVNGVGARLAAQDTDAVRFLFSSGNITSGTIRMFGIV